MRRMRKTWLALAIEGAVMASHTHGTTALHLALAWGFVGIPLAWGVIETVLNAMKLFS
jgi:hypothetical protein